MTEDELKRRISSILEFARPKQIDTSTPAVSAMGGGSIVAGGDVHITVRHMPRAVDRYCRTARTRPKMESE